jgi:hypothetical protein
MCWFPAPLHKGAGRLVQRAGLRGTVRRRGMPLMMMLPLGGAIGRPARVSPRAHARGACDAGRWLRDVAAPDEGRQGLNVPRRLARA